MFPSRINPSFVCLAFAYAVSTVWRAFFTSRLASKSLFCRRCQIASTKSLSYIIQLISISHTEIRRPFSLVLHQRDVYLCYVLSFVHIFRFRLVSHDYCYRTSRDQSASVDESPRFTLRNRPSTSVQRPTSDLSSRTLSSSALSSTTVSRRMLLLTWAPLWMET